MDFCHCLNSLSIIQSACERTAVWLAQAAAEGLWFSLCLVWLVILLFPPCWSSDQQTADTFGRALCCVFLPLLILPQICWLDFIATLTNTPFQSQPTSPPEITASLDISKTSYYCRPVATSKSLCQSISVKICMKCCIMYIRKHDILILLCCMSFILIHKCVIAHPNNTVLLWYKNGKKTT